MFWFTVSVVLLIIWLSERADSKKKSEILYTRGLDEGRRGIIEQIRALLDAGDKSIDAHKLRALIDDERRVDTSLQSAVTTDVDQGADVSYEAPYTEDSVIQPELTAEELEAEKIRRTTSNLNAMLYVGSFLIVAAAALFVNLTMPASIKLMSIVFVMTAFYVAGLVLYAKSVRLRSAAIAFVGTGLAILPFVGFALRSLGGLSNEAAWFVTSAAGLVAYAVAAIYLRSQLVSYITMAFVVSLSLSAVSVLSLGIVWYFIVLIGVSIVINTIHYLRPNLLPSVFAVPLDQTSKVTTPIALGASLLVWQSMELFMYEVLFAIATLHYAVVWLESRLVSYELITRSLAHITALLFALDAALKIGGKDGVILFGVAWVLVAAAQILYSILRANPLQQRGIRREGSVIGIMFSLMLLALPVWFTAAHPAYWAAGHLVLVGLLSVAVSARFRHVGWLYIGLAVSVALPVIVMRGVIDPALPAWAIALVFAAFGFASLVALDQLKDKLISDPKAVLGIVAVVTYAAAVALCGIAAQHSPTLSWTMTIAATLLGLLSYLVRVIAFEAAGALIGIVAVAAVVNWLLPDSEWQSTVTVVTATALLTAAVFAHHENQEHRRRDVLAVIGAIVVASLIGVVQGASNEVIRAAIIILIVSGVAMLALRIAVKAKENTLSWLALAGYLTYPTLALIVSLQAGGGWVPLTAIILAGIVWTGSYIEKQPSILLVGNVLFSIGLALLWSWLSFSGEWLVHGVSWLSAAVFYLMYWYSRDRNDSTRLQLSIVSVLGMLAIASLWGLFASQPSMVMASAGSLLMASAVGGMHGYMVKKPEYIEAALYVATLGLQRMVGLLIPSVNIVFYGHWWALVMMSVAVWRKSVLVRPIIALSFLTVPTGLYALAGTEGYSLLFLAENLVVAVVGALTRRQWAMWWGIVAVIISVLYFLRNYTVAALLFLGFLIILFVVWRLMKSDKTG